MIDKDKTLKEVLRLLGEHLYPYQMEARASVKADTPLAGLDLDSLDHVELLVAFECELGADIPHDREDDLQKLFEGPETTVGLLAERLAEWLVP